MFNKMTGILFDLDFAFGFRFRSPLLFLDLDGRLGFLRGGFGFVFLSPLAPGIK